MKHDVQLPIRVHRLQADGAVPIERRVFCAHCTKTTTLQQRDACDDCAVAVEEGLDGTHWMPQGTPGSVTPVVEVMTRDVFCVTSDVSIHSVVALLLERGYTGAPVVDKEGRPVGMVSRSDLLRYYVDGQTESSSPGTDPLALERGLRAEDWPGALVEEVMTPIALTVTEMTPLSQAAALMATEGIHRVPVVSQQGEVIGLLCSLDLLRWLGEMDGFLHPHLHR